MKLETATLDFENKKYKLHENTKIYDWFYYVLQTTRNNTFLNYT